MSKYVIEIDESVNKRINNYLDTTLKIESKRLGVPEVVAQSVYDVVCSHKDDIYRKCVTSAITELANRKLLEFIESNEKEYEVEE